MRYHLSIVRMPRISALVVKWISLLSSEQSLGVRIPPGAQKATSCFLIRFAHKETMSGTRPKYIEISRCILCRWRYRRDSKAGLSEGEGGGVAGEHSNARPVTESPTVERASFT